VIELRYQASFRATRSEQVKGLSTRVWEPELFAALESLNMPHRATSGSRTLLCTFARFLVKSLRRPPAPPHPAVPTFGTRCWRTTSPGSPGFPVFPKRWNFEPGRERRSSD
jgi:hypothetical protein